MELFYLATLKQQETLVAEMLVAQKVVSVLIVMQPLQ